MISFKILARKALNEVILSIADNCPGADLDYVQDISEELLSANDGCEYALSTDSGCLLIRVFDDGYFFLCPEPIAEEFDVLKAIDALRLYSVKEEIGLTISEVPRELIEEISGLFANAETVEEDISGELFSLTAKSEVWDLTELPTVKGKSLSLTPLCSDDEKKYAALCRDEETNKYWGYNYREDMPSCTDSSFLENADSELKRGIAASFAIRMEGDFIGEAILYAFDLLGGAECALRLLPEYRGRGLSGECIELICKVAKSISLSRLYATVDERNDASVALFSRHFVFIENRDGKSRFLLEL